MYEEERNGKEDEMKGKKTVGINFMKGGYEMGIIIVDERKRNITSINDIR